MKKILSLLTFVAAAAPVMSQTIDIATCRNPSGMAYRHYTGNNDQKEAGWTEEKITNGVVSVIKDSVGKFDILFIDSRKSQFLLPKTGDG